MDLKGAAPARAGLRPSVTASRPSGEGRRPVEDAKLKEACQQFESLFIQQLFKESRQGLASLSGEQRSFGREVYEGWQDEQYARAMSSSGGIGLADMLYRQLSGTILPPARRPPQ